MLILRSSHRQSFQKSQRHEPSQAYPDLAEFVKLFYLTSTSTLRFVAFLYYLRSSDKFRSTLIATHCSSSYPSSRVSSRLSYTFIAYLMLP